MYLFGAEIPAEHLLQSLVFRGKNSDPVGGGCCSPCVYYQQENKQQFSENKKKFKKNDFAFHHLCSKKKLGVRWKKTERRENNSLGKSNTQYLC